MRLHEESHVGMKLYDSGIYYVFDKISPFCTFKLEGIFMLILCVYIFDINMKTKCDLLVCVWGE